MRFKEVFQHLAEFFGKERIDYALIGAFALKAYGYVRATQDIDFIVRHEAQSRIVAYLESLGFETIYRSPGFSNHVHPLSGLGRIDFVYVKGETAERIFKESGKRMIFNDMSIPVVSPEHLVALKVFAMKNDPDRGFHEMADIKFLLGLPGVDLQTVKGFFEKYGQMDRCYELFPEERKHGS